MRPDPAVGNSFSLEQLYEEWPRNVQEVGGLLCGQLDMYRDDRYGIPVRHLTQNFEKQFEGLARDCYLVLAS